MDGRKRLQYATCERVVLGKNIWIRVRARGSLITSSRTIILRFTSHETNIYAFMLLKNRGRTKYQKLYVSPIL